MGVTAQSIQLTAIVASVNILHTILLQGAGVIVQFQVVAQTSVTTAAVRLTDHIIIRCMLSSINEATDPHAQIVATLTALINANALVFPSTNALYASRCQPVSLDATILFMPRPCYLIRRA